MHIGFYYKDTLLAELDVDPLSEKAQNYVWYTDDIQMLPFGNQKDPDYVYFMEYLKTRCWDPNRPDLKDILSRLGLDSYDPLAIVLKTHGRRYNDHFWMKFDSDPKEITYDKIRARAK